MAKTFTAPFAQTQKTAVVTAALATTGITTNTPGNIVQLLQAGTDGALLTRLTVIPRGQIASVGGLLFLSKAADSHATILLIDSETIPSYTDAATTGYPETGFLLYSEDAPLRLEAGDRLHVGLKAAPANPVAFKAEYSDY